MMKVSCSLVEMCQAQTTQLKKTIFTYLLDSIKYNTIFEGIFSHLTLDQTEIISLIKDIRFI